MIVRSFNRMVMYDCNTQVNRLQAASWTFQALAPTTAAGCADFRTSSGIKVSVYKADITQLSVDAIVSATNENLCQGGGGVSGAIASAAGYKLKEEGANYLRRHGSLRVKKVMVTTGGSLACSKVLHAVGPRWSDYADKAQCQRHLVDTVYNCLLQADSLGLSSLAMSSISSGLDTHLQTDTLMHRHTNIDVQMHTNVYTCAHTNIYTYTCTHHVPMYTLSPTHSHTQS